MKNLSLPTDSKDADRKVQHQANMLSLVGAVIGLVAACVPLARQNGFDWSTYAALILATCAFFPQAVSVLIFLRDRVGAKTAPQRLTLVIMSMILLGLGLFALMMLVSGFIGTLPLPDWLR